MIDYIDLYDTQMIINYIDPYWGFLTSMVYLNYITYLRHAILVRNSRYVSQMDPVPYLES